MVKRIVLTVLQIVAFLGLMYVGGLSDIINLSLESKQIAQGNMHPTVPIHTIRYPLGTHILIVNGFLYAGILLVLIILLQAITKRLKPWAALSLLGFVLAVMLAFATKMGLPPAS